MTAVVSCPAEIRRGTLHDCRDLLTVYQTTRWFSRQYSTVEEVKSEHRGRLFNRREWRVAVMDDRVVGETVFRNEETSWGGLIGIIDSIDVDIRYQKQHIGTGLVRNAEQELAQRGATRVVTYTAPENYNFWMKLGYFSRGSIVRLRCRLADVRTRGTLSVRGKPLAEFYHTPRILRYSNVATPGLVGRLASEIVDRGHRGRVLQVVRDEKTIGVAVVLKRDPVRGEIAVDVYPGNENLMQDAIILALRASSRYRVSEVECLVPSDRTHYFEETGSWRVEDPLLVPVTRLL